MAQCNKLSNIGQMVQIILISSKEIGEQNDEIRINDQKKKKEKVIEKKYKYHLKIACNL